tara:strand:- start:86 stop:538 length:453 start_codon:yes stop_codon:yes gene_type:complete
MKSFKTFIIENNTETFWHGGKPISSIQHGTIWLSSSRHVAEINAVGSADAGKYYQIKGRGGDPMEVLGKKVEKLSIDTTDFMIIDCNGDSYYKLGVPDIMKDDVFDPEMKLDTDSIADWAKENGYSGVLFKNIFEGKGVTETSDVVAVFR